MPIDNLAKWTILPNWRQPVVERLSWLSAVLTSDSGAEQRFGLRWSPRRSFEPIFTVTGRVRALLDVSLAAAGAAEWYVPVWHDGNVLTAPLSLGAASITTDTAFREFKVGGYVMLWENEFTAEVHEVTSVGSGTVGIDPVTSREWPIGTRVFPCVRARVGDIPELSRKTGTVFEGGIRFDISTDNDWSDVAATIDLPTYLTYRVLTQRPNRREDLSLRYERMIEDLDNDVGLTLRRDVSGLAFPVQSHSWLRLGREEQAKLRALLYDLSGRVTPLWVPTFDDDLLLADDVDAADTTLLIHTAGLDTFGVPFAGREHICIRLRDGTHIFRQITGVASSGDTETVTLSAAVGQTFTRREVHSVSFMSLCRQNADEAEFNHVTDAGNATEVTVSFRHAPDIRSATDIGVPLIGNTAMNSAPCGECVPLLVPTGPYFLLAAASLTGNPPRMYETNMISGDGGAFGFAYMQGAESDGRFVQIAADNTASTRTSTHDTDATSTVATYTARTSDGRYLVLTGSYYPLIFGGESDIKARFFDADGVPDGAAVQIAGAEVYPGGANIKGVVPDDAGGYYYLHFWLDSGAIPQGLNIERRNASHAVVTPRVQVMASDDNWGALEGHTLARSESTLAAVMHRYYVSGKSARLAVSFYDLDLVALATNVEVSDIAPLDNDSRDLYVNIREAPGGQTAVMWVDQPNSDDNFVGSTARIRFFLPDGTPAGASQSLFATGTVDEFSPDDPLRNPTDFVLSASGNYLAVTESVNDYDSGSRITYLTLFENQSGTWVQVQTRTVDDTPDLDFAYFDYDSRMELLSNGEIVVAYQQYGAGPDNDIRARRFTLTECL
jgi:hypothetical protein